MFSRVKQLNPLLEVIHSRPSSRHPNRAPVLLLHGAWHAAWSWENWIPYFVDRGHEVYAPSFRGHGASGGRYQTARIADYLDDTRRVIATIDRPPIVVGHSFGGWILQHLLAERSFPAAVLVASVPNRYPPSVIWKNFRKQPSAMLRAYLKRDLITFTETPLQVREFFSAKASDEIIESTRARLTGASLWLFLGMALNSPPRPKDGTPTLVIAPSEDNNFTIAMQTRLANRMSGDLRVVEHSGHDVALDVNWRSSADLVSDWLTGIG